MPTTLLRSALSLATAAALSAPALLVAQELQEKEFPKPTGTLQDLEPLRSVIELSDGRVMLLDARGGKLLFGDFQSRKTSGTKLAVGTEDNEVRSLGTLWRWAADSVASLDLGKARLTIITPEGTFGRAESVRDRAAQMDAPAGAPPAGFPPGPGARRPTPVLYSSFVGDYLVGIGIAPPQRPAGPTLPPPRPLYPVLRTSIKTLSTDTVVKLLGEQMPRAQERNTGLGTLEIFLGNVPVQSVDTWAALSDGTIAVIRAANYKIDLFSPNGERTQVGPVPFTPIPVTNEDKSLITGEYKKEASARVRLAAGQLQGLTVNYSEAKQWPANHPPFEGGQRPLVDSQDRIWLATRCTKDAKASCYDVIDRNATRVARFKLPPSSRVVAFGASHVYVVDNSKSDKLSLHRHPSPF
jgi:hypothetical protein